jgi:mycofactocin system transcriptional regulator
MSLTPAVRGRPAVTSHDKIERAAFRLFAAEGFEATTLDAIADELEVSRRTVTRYYGSKNDIPWGQFDDTLANFAAVLSEMPKDLPLCERVHRGVIAFNTFPDTAEPAHEERMRLILRTPALQAHSVLRYGQWRAVIADFVASETGQPSSALLPQLVGQVSLALAMTAYEQWLAGQATNARLLHLLDQAMGQLREYVQVA